MCHLSNNFWKEILVNADFQRILIRMFYQHEFNLMCLESYLKLCAPSPYEAAQIIFKVLEIYSVSEIIQILNENFVPFTIEAKDIPQFSSFDDCYIRVPSDLLSSGNESVNFDKMGFFLRKESRKVGADKKYGENHAKTAALMGLCEIKRKVGITTTPLGVAFDSLPMEEKVDLKPKLCLYIPLIQNYFVQGCDDRIIKDSMSILSLSTQKRRASNVKCLINIVKDSIDNELYQS